MKLGSDSDQAYRLHAVHLQLETVGQFVNSFQLCEPEP